MAKRDGLASPAQMRALVRRFRGRRIAVVGDLMLDRFLRGSVRRVSPEAPVPVVDQPETAHLGGAGNVAANLAALGARPTIFGVIGADPAGRTVCGQLARWRVSQAGLLRAPGRPTTVKMRIIADHQHVLRADWEKSGPLEPGLVRRLLDVFRRSVARLDGVSLSDYDKGVLTETLVGGMLETCAARGLPVFVDLKRPRRLEASAKGGPAVTLILVNQRRAEEIAGRAIRDRKSLELVGRHMMARFPCSLLIISRGPEGMVVFEKGDAHRIAAVRTRPWEVFDVTGAGDTVMAALTLGLMAGAIPLQAVRVANAAAGVVVGKLGTVACSREELLVALGTNRRRP